MERKGLFFAVTIGGALASGCATGPVNTEADFGNSVRMMIGAQRYSPESIGKPAGMDGQKAEVVLKSYRDAIGKPQDMKREVTVNFGK